MNEGPTLYINDKVVDVAASSISRFDQHVESFGPRRRLETRIWTNYGSSAQNPYGSLRVVSKGIANYREDGSNGLDRAPTQESSDITFTFTSVEQTTPLRAEEQVLNALALGTLPQSFSASAEYNFVIRARPVVYQDDAGVSYALKAAVLDSGSTNGELKTITGTREGYDLPTEAKAAAALVEGETVDVLQFGSAMSSLVDAVLRRKLTALRQDVRNDTELRRAEDWTRNHRLPGRF